MRNTPEDTRRNALHAPGVLARSRALAIRVNLVKLLALSALVPPVAVGLAQRASVLSAPGADASAVAAAGTLGSACAVLGALALGRLADLRGALTRLRWWIVTAGSAVGLAGSLAMAFAVALWQLLAGWGLAQFGFSGAMAVLRAMLATASPVHRKRGATVMVLVSYLGAFLPLLLLFFLPSAVWQSTVALAALAFAAPLGVLLLGYRSADSPARRERPAPHTGADPGSGAGPDTATGPAEDRRNRIPWPALLAAHFAAHLALSAYLSFHALDIAERERGSWSDAAVQTSVLTLVTALVGLLASAGALIARPKPLDRPRTLLIGAGLTLALSTGLRPFADALPALLALMLLSGAAVGANSAAVFSAVLAAAPAGRGGRRLGVYSALTPLGQLLGPLAGLAVIEASAPETAYRNLFFAVAAVLLLGVAVVLWFRPRDGPRRAG